MKERWIGDPLFGVGVTEFGESCRIEGEGLGIVHFSEMRYVQRHELMQNAQKEEFKHFGMDLEFLLRRTPEWRAILQDILFKPGDIVEHGEEAEEEH